MDPLASVPDDGADDEPPPVVHHPQGDGQLPEREGAEMIANPSSAELDGMDMFDELSISDSPRITEAKDETYASVRFGFRILWSYFGYFDFYGMVTILHQIIAGHCLTQFYVGITSDPLWRFAGERKKMVGHRARFRWLFPILLADTMRCRWVERFLIQRFKFEDKDPRCMNRSRGGERLANNQHDTTFLYLAGSDTLNTDIWQEP